MKIANVKAFIQSLSEKVYDVEELSKTPLHKEMINEMIQSFYIKKRKGKKQKTDDILIDLVLNYDASFQLISPIGIWDEYVETDLFIKFGQVIEEGDLAIWKGTNEIFCVQAYNEMDISYFVAQDSNSFLEAFLINGIHEFTRNFKTESEKKKFFNERAIAASEAAGGEKYKRFWYSLSH